MNHFTSILIRALVWCGIICCGACSSGTPYFPVEGKVLHKGKELSNVTVTFHPKDGHAVNTPRPTGLTGEDGTFKLTTGSDVGAPPGEYTVTFMWLKEIPAKDRRGGGFGSAGTETVDAFEGAFVNESKSKHKVTIKSEATKLEPFRLE